MTPQMSIKSIAEAHGISRPAVYAIMRKNGLKTAAKRGNYSQKELKTIDKCVQLHQASKQIIITVPDIQSMAVPLDLSLDERITHNRRLYRLVIEATNDFESALRTMQSDDADEDAPRVGIKNLGELAKVTAKLDSNLISLERERGDEVGEKPFDPFA